MTDEEKNALGLQFVADLRTDKLECVILFLLGAYDTARQTINPDHNFALLLQLIRAELKECFRQ